MIERSVDAGESLLDGTRPSLEDKREASPFTEIDDLVIAHERAEEAAVLLRRLRAGVLTSSCTFILMGLSDVFTPPSVFPDARTELGAYLVLVGGVCFLFGWLLLSGPKRKAEGELEAIEAELADRRRTRDMSPRIPGHPDN